LGRDIAEISSVTCLKSAIEEMAFPETPHQVAMVLILMVPVLHLSRESMVAADLTKETP
jgi:hypothetical protein